MDEPSLIRRAAAGDQAAFEMLVSRHAAAILGVARARTRDAALADEIAQDTFVRLFQNLSRFRAESSLRTWLVRVALNRCTDLQRSDPRRFEGALEPAGEYPSGDEGAERLGFAHIATNVPGLELGLNEVAAPAVSRGVVINISITDVTAGRTALEAKGVKFIGPTAVIPGKVALAEFADPDGHRLRLAGPPPR